MKILFVLEYHYPHIGGVETLFKSLTEELAAKGYTVTVITNKFSPELASAEILNGVSIKRYNFINRYIFTFLSVFPIINEAKKHDLIHTTSYNAGLPSYIAAKFTNTKVVITFHEVWNKLWYKLPFLNYLSKNLYYYFEAFLLNLSFDQFIAVSDYTKDALEQSGIDSHKIRKIYNGIDYSQFNTLIKENVNNDEFTFCYFGRLGVSKGIDILLPAIQMCKRKGNKFIFILIIPSESKLLNKYVIDQIRSLQIEDIVVIKQDLSRDTLIQTITNCDAVVIPSYSEGFGFTAVETMALEIPIISSAKGALHEVVSGKHVNMASFSSQGLSDAMEDALSDKWTYSPKKRFTLEDSVEEYCSLYTSLDPNAISNS